MADLTLGEMLALQQALQDAHAHEWRPVDPSYGREAMLWMIEEIGETASIIKKKGDSAIMKKPAVRAAFTEEMADVLMYYLDVCLSYGISAESLAAAFREKNARNMTRDYTAQYKDMMER